jgi:peptidase, M16 family
LFNYLYNNVDADAGYQRFVEQLTPQDMQRFAKLVVENKKRIEVTMSSEKIQ